MQAECKCVVLILYAGRRTASIAFTIGYFHQFPRCCSKTRRSVLAVAIIYTCMGCISSIFYDFFCQWVSTHGYCCWRGCMYFSRSEDRRPCCQHLINVRCAIHTWQAYVSAYYELLCHAGFWYYYFPRRLPVSISSPTQQDSWQPHALKSNFPTCCQLQQWLTNGRNYHERTNNFGQHIKSNILICERNL
jgi:hypothetical protein